MLEFFNILMLTFTHNSQNPPEGVIFHSDLGSQYTSIVSVVK